MLHARIAKLYEKQGNNEMKNIQIEKALHYNSMLQAPEYLSSSDINKIF